jgi:hypothetical protein
VSRKLTNLIILVSVLTMTGHVSAELVGHWRLDDGSGTITADSSGYGNDGTLQGNPQWVTGMINGALEFDGTGDYVEVPDDESLHLWERFTLAAWIYQVESRSSRIIDKIGAGTANGPHLDTHPGTKLRCCAGTCISTDTDHTLEEWHHVAVTFDEGDVKLYVDGSIEGEGIAPSPLAGNNLPLRIGADSDGQSLFHGLIDDVRVYNMALTEAEILAAMEGSKGYPYALGPSPKDGELYSDTWATISWRAGDFAISHNVYIGDNFDDVNEATRDSDLFRGNQELEYIIVGFAGYPYPDGLVPGTTYYWRIDEVNDSEPNSPWKGNVWSFSLPPKTAYFPDPSDGTELVDLDAKLSWTAGFGAKLHYIVFGEDFDEVSNAAMGKPYGSTNYSPGLLKLAKTYYWRIDESDGFDTYKGEVWSFTTIGAASNPNPANGAVDIKPSAILKWDAGSVAASHEVYFGTDEDAVRNATTASSEYKGPKALGEESYDPGKLEFNSVYYWRVDEVNDVNSDSPWAGNVWSFTTGDFFVIDDFEDYDTGENQIWYAWHDGLGYGAPGTDPYYAGNGTGAAVGDETTASYTEETIVHNGGKSMPISYDNNKQGYAYYSEVEHKLSDQRDWTERGVGELSIWFRGISDNSAEPLYVAVSNSTGAPAIVVHDDANAAQIDTWTQWVIPLSSFADQGIVLTDVDKIAIGLGTQGNITIPGGSGKMYIDDIHLYRPREAAQ